MGTRAITKVKDGAGTILVCMYSQFDGYPDKRGMGIQLKEFLENGFRKDNIRIEQHPMLGERFNGLDDIAAQMVAYFKSKVPGIYLYPHDVSVGDCGTEFEYEISPMNESSIWLKFKSRKSEWETICSIVE